MEAKGSDQTVEEMDAEGMDQTGESVQLIEISSHDESADSGRFFKSILK